MNYDIFTATFPTLEGKTVRLREVREADIPVLFTLLQDPDVLRDYCVEGGFETKEQVKYIYLTCARANYQSRQQIQWLVEEKATGTILGVRDLFVDNAVKPLTVQGFMGKAFRKRGFSKEAYTLILDYTRQHGAAGLMANTSVENFAAVALLFSVGFKPDYVAFTSDDMRMVFRNDYAFEDKYSFPDANLKRLYIFCKMYLHATDINITDDMPIKYDGRMHKAYKVRLTALNTAGPSLQDRFMAKLVFHSNGVIIMAEGESGKGISFLDGRTAYLNAWGFCWNECLVN
jgi:RimJ/RimL family protein N-acetyltransferase